MTRLNAILAAALLTTATWSGANAQVDHPETQAQPQTQSQAQTQARPSSPFQAPQYVSAILQGPLALLNGPDREARNQRLHYVLGFSLTLDKTCDFLSAYTVRQLDSLGSPTMVALANQGLTPRTEQLLRHAAAGSQDAKAILDQFGCSSEVGRKAARSLAVLWEST